MTTRVTSAWSTVEAGVRALQTMKDMLYKYKVGAPGINISTGTEAFLDFIQEKAAMTVSAPWAMSQLKGTAVENDYTDCAAPAVCGRQAQGGLHLRLGLGGQLQVAQSRPKPGSWWTMLPSRAHAGCPLPVTFCPAWVGPNSRRRQGFQVPGRVHWSVCLWAPAPDAPQCGRDQCNFAQGSRKRRLEQPGTQDFARRRPAKEINAITNK